MLACLLVLYVIDTLWCVLCVSLLSTFCPAISNKYWTQLTKQNFTSHRIIIQVEFMSLCQNRLFKIKNLFLPLFFAHTTPSSAQNSFFYEWRKEKSFIDMWARGNEKFWYFDPNKAQKHFMEQLNKRRTISGVAALAMIWFQSLKWITLLDITSVRCGEGSERSIFIIFCSFLCSHMLLCFAWLWGLFLLCCYTHADPRAQSKKSRFDRIPILTGLVQYLSSSSTLSLHLRWKNM